MSADISRLLCPPRDMSLQRNKKACAQDDWGRGGGGSSVVGECCVHAETMCAWPQVVLDSREGKCLLVCLTHIKNSGQLENSTH